VLINDKVITEVVVKVIEKHKFLRSKQLYKHLLCMLKRILLISESGSKKYVLCGAKPASGEFYHYIIRKMILMKIIC